MMIPRRVSIISVLYFLALYSASSLGEESLHLHMPNVTPTTPDQYMCINVPAPAYTIYITAFQPKANMTTAHHMLLFACAEPGDNKPFYNCNTPCGYQGSSTFIYAWGRQAPPLKLPPDVAFDVGGTTNYRYFGLQVHYLNPLNRTDSTGVILTYSRVPTKNRAGIALLAAGGSIPGQRTKFSIDTACHSESVLPIYPFGFRTHAHTLSRTIVGYVVHNATGELQEIGRASPQWPQAFYPTNKGITISKGDLLMARCVYDSMDRTHVTHIGSTHMDEMCNFYLMFYVSRSSPLSDDVCISEFKRDLDKKFPPNSTDYLPTDLPNNYFTKDQPSKSSPPLVTATFLPLLMNVSTEYMADDEWKVDQNLGQVGGVALDPSSNHLVVFHRGSRVWDRQTFDEKDNLRDSNPIRENTVLHVDISNGTVVKQWGSSLFALPHGIYVDQKRSHVWITDVGAHLVMRFDYGQWASPTLTLGTLRVSGMDEKHFCKPADVATNAKGEIFVADGYCNSRVVKFSPDGKFVKSWVSSDGSFQVVHSITVLEEFQWVCVADRERAAIECFDFDGNFKKRIVSPGEQKLLGDAVFAITWDAIHRRLLGTSILGNLPNPQRAFGFSLPLNNDTHLVPSIQWWNKSSENLDIHSPHDLTVTPDGKTIFVAQLSKTKVKKFQLHELPEKVVKSTKRQKQNVTLPISPATTTPAKVTPPTKNSIFMASTDSMLKANTYKIIGIALVVPPLLIIAVIAIMRLCRSYNSRCASLSTVVAQTNRRFTRTVAFQPLQQEESDMEETVSINEERTRNLKNGHNL